MPLFTKFKKAKDAAVEHKKTAAAEQAKPPAPPYRHVPTHAKQDALATQPTTLRPEELQARIAAARKRRAASWQAAVPSHHSVYHSCESSRASSRANSTINFPHSSTHHSFKGKGSSVESIDAILGWPHSASHSQGLPMVNGRLQPIDLSSPIMGKPSGFPLPPPQRPRLSATRSRKSSFTKKKSPLSSVSVEEEPDEMFSSSSNTSHKSTQSSATNESRHSDSIDDKAPEDVAAIQVSRPSISMPTPVVHSPQSPMNPPLVRQKSKKWPRFQRKAMDITAH